MEIRSACDGNMLWTIGRVDPGDFVLLAEAQGLVGEGNNRLRQKPETIRAHMGLGAKEGETPEPVMIWGRGKNRAQTVYTVWCSWDLVFLSTRETARVGKRKGFRRKVRVPRQAAARLSDATWAAALASSALSESRGVRSLVELHSDQSRLFCGNIMSITRTDDGGYDLDLLLHGSILSDGVAGGMPLYLNLSAGEWGRLTVGLGVIPPVPAGYVFAPVIPQFVRSGTIKLSDILSRKGILSGGVNVGKTAALKAAQDRAEELVKGTPWKVYTP